MTKDLDAPGAACLDAETLAAWADEGLESRERAAVEAHAAGCARCQALLAAMVRTLPPPSAEATPFRMRSRWWLAAMAPVAAALVVWFAVPERAPVQRSQSAAEEPAAPAAAPPVEARAAVQADTPPTSGLDKERDAPAIGKDVAALEKKAAPPASANAIAAAEAVGATSQAAGAVAVPAPLVAAARLSAFANPLDSLIVSSNPATRFRLLPGGGVQRSADGGATWRTEATGATVTLTAGSSPSPSVCWLIGPNGTILLSTDGRSWRRLPFPEAVDLRSVGATDNENATVSAVDGRAFVTTDGGQTWARAPEIQGGRSPF